MTTVKDLARPQYRADTPVFMSVGDMPTLSIYRWYFFLDDLTPKQKGVVLSNGTDSIIVKNEDLFHLGKALIAESERQRLYAEIQGATKP